MNTNKQDDFIGFYIINKSPKRLAEHNATSWEKIENLFNSKSGIKAHYDELCSVVIGHKHGTKGVHGPEPFIKYCIKNGWLKIIDSASDKQGSDRIDPILCETQEQLETAISDIGAITSVPKGQTQPSKTVSESNCYIRDATVVAYVLNQSDGVCECCDNPSPFLKADGTPYLEVHHVKQLSAGGSDTVSNAISACPNCHRELHFGKKAKDLGKLLYQKVQRLIKE